MISNREWLNDVNIAYEKGKLKGREDAINECIIVIKKLDFIHKVELIKILEQLKEL